MNDLKFAFRQLLKNPGFTAVAVLTLALGIGANTAIFSFVNTILLRPLPYRDPDQLVMVFETRATDSSSKEPVAAPMLGEWRKQSSVFEGLAARGGDSFNLSGRGQAEALTGTRVSANMFSLLGLRPELGRDFLPEEETFGKHHVVLLSHELWQRRFGGDAGIVGQAITLNSEPHTVGVFAGAALGLYGVLAYNVSQRTREIGIRMALGARRREVQGLIVGQGMRLTLVGVGFGLAAALALSRVLQTLLFEIKPTDPATFTAVAALLSLVAFLACWLPARRAARVDPMVALRTE